VCIDRREGGAREREEEKRKRTGTRRHKNQGEQEKEKKKKGKGQERADIKTSSSRKQQHKNTTIFTKQKKNGSSVLLYATVETTKGTNPPAFIKIITPTRLLCLFLSFTFFLHRALVYSHCFSLEVFTEQMFSLPFSSLK